MCVDWHDKYWLQYYILYVIHIYIGGLSLYTLYPQLSEWWHIWWFIIIYTVSTAVRMITYLVVYHYIHCIHSCQNDDISGGLSLYTLYPQLSEWSHIWWFIIIYTVSTAVRMITYLVVYHYIHCIHSCQNDHISIMSKFILKIQ
jgi:hypothetical protein